MRLVQRGLRMLNSWFLLALRREQENADLIQRLGQLASKDPLTGIANRRAFEARMEQEILTHRRDGKRFGLIMVDVDHFKLYNDHYGHQRGDECLTVIARTLEMATRDNAGDVGRIGAEEFGILLPDADITAVQRVAKTIASALANQALPHAVSPVSPNVTVSQGLTIWEAHQTAESVIARADKALYMAKQQGRNRWTVAE